MAALIAEGECVGWCQSCPPQSHEPVCPRVLPTRAPIRSDPERVIASGPSSMESFDSFYFRRQLRRLSSESRLPEPIDFGILTDDDDDYDEDDHDIDVGASADDDLDIDGGDDGDGPDVAPAA
ncbi:uncharacterized protein A4U43_C05F14380 [Asparagus officinalis]|uniref:Uncharacterized protein n=1 Tax=Asparagus officinalis TaxID=4686 RepID=A0A5P1ERK3_ASPOF|nr:uncharacterized protein A4U43_C05F14380 [Asparagus officinalis]